VQNIDAHGIDNLRNEYQNNIIIIDETLNNIKFKQNTIESDIENLKSADNNINDFVNNYIIEMANKTKDIETDVSTISGYLTDAVSDISDNKTNINTIHTDISGMIDDIEQLQ
jgi:uncharacterized phage infection (PIP) family protein YhgE